MAATPENPIIFYDLINVNGVHWSPNTYKTRLCLEYKKLPYRIEYFTLPEIESKMKELGVPPIKDTSPQYTLPVIADPSDDPREKPHYIGDSFKIAVYLDEKYPAPRHPAIFNSGARSIEHLFIHQYLPTVARAGSAVVMPKLGHILDKESVEYIKRTRGDLFNPLPEQEAEEKWKAFREKFFDIGMSLDYRDEGGPFIAGSRPTMIDFAIGGWFHLLQRIEPSELEHILDWHDGRWRLFWEHIQDIAGRSPRGMGTLASVVNCRHIHQLTAIFKASVISASVLLSMAATKENPIIFYDLHDGKGASWSPNPYKTRMCLIHKGLPYQVEYLSFPEVEPKLKELGVPPTSENFPYYTLPVIADPSSDPHGKPTYVAESFAIAIYLDEKYPAPEYPAIFPSGTRGVQHLLVNQYFPGFVTLLLPLLYPKLPQLIDEQSMEYVRRTRPLEMLKPLPKEEEIKKWQDVRDKFSILAKGLDLNGGDTFIMGSQPSFIDFVFGGVFFYIEKLDSSRMKEIATWHDGKWGKYWERLQAIERGPSRVEQA
ncbi:unnamed protein product [Rhizoctonia solani]|uniref:GST N-terminal domain-containing protein n=1 Tax=Rhizoctonia solani TaxID=456999 RepID=A0A8H2ZZ33_9AGAM|nr:unnamed protein product [Rhizoctonia solani]